MTADSPTQLQPGIVVRIRMAGGHVYTSKRLQRGEADQVAAALRDRFRRNASLVDLPEFPSAELLELSVRADRVAAVEVRCVNGDGSLRAADPTLDGELR